MRIVVKENDLLVRIDRYFKNSAVLNKDYRGIGSVIEEVSGGLTIFITFENKEENVGGTELINLIEKATGLKLNHARPVYYNMQEEGIIIHILDF